MTRPRSSPRETFGARVQFKLWPSSQSTPWRANDPEKSAGGEDKLDILTPRLDTARANGAIRVAKLVAVSEESPRVDRVSIVIQE